MYVQDLREWDVMVNFLSLWRNETVDMAGKLFYLHVSLKKTKICVCTVSTLSSNTPLVATEEVQYTIQANIMEPLTSLVCGFVYYGVLL